MNIRQAEKICHRYNTELRFYKAEFEQANENEGIRGKTAEQYFDSYVAEMERCNACDGKAATEFEHNAYGRL